MMPWGDPYSTKPLPLISSWFYLPPLCLPSCLTCDHCDTCWMHCTSWGSCWWSFSCLSLLESSIWNADSSLYHKWLLTDLWLVNLVFKRLKKARLDKQQEILLSLRSNPQTMSPYIQNCDGLCTRTDHHILLPIVLHCKALARMT